jgi:hypothetical protein
MDGMVAEIMAKQVGVFVPLNEPGEELGVDP